MVNFPLFPEQASTFAPKVDLMYYSLWVFLIIFSVAVLGTLIGLGIFYRQRLGSGRRSTHVENLPLELTWTAIPFVLAMGIFAWGAVLYFDYADAPENTLDISVMGKQWMWKMQHPNGMREVNELTIPVNQPVKLTMWSQDVIHSFFVPAFRVKQDVLPGIYTQLWFEATKEGSFPLFCAEYCGTEHSTMGGLVHVVSAQEYEDFLEGGPAVTPVARGEALFLSMGCATCHMAGDLSRGPDLYGLFGSEVRLTTGQTLTADEEYIRESILQPGVKVVEGYAPLMPGFQGQVDDDDLASLVAYIKSLPGNE